MVLGARWKVLRNVLGIFLVGLLGGVVGSWIFAMGYRLEAVGKDRHRLEATGYRQEPLASSDFISSLCQSPASNDSSSLQPLAYSGFSSTAEADTAEAESITLTTYYPSPYGMYDGLGTYRLSVGDTNGVDGINNADLPTTPGYLLVADRVGIGTTFPQRKFVVADTDPLWSLKRLGSVVADGMGWAVWSPSGSNQFRIHEYVASDWSGGFDRFAIDTGGNVGIGTTTPENKLTIDTTNLSGNPVHLGFTDTSQTDYSSWYFAPARCVGCYAPGTGIGDLVLRSAQVDDNFMITTDNGATTALTVASSSNVGIGTTTPASSLHVVGIGNTNPSLTYRSANAWSLETGRAELVGGILTAEPWSYWLQTRYWADAALPLSLNPLGGNVGIGTTGPNAKLSVSTNGSATTAMSSSGEISINDSAPEIAFNDSDNNDWMIHVDSNKLYFIREPWNYSDLVLDGSGNVGIGTATPNYRLDLGGGTLGNGFLGANSQSWSYYNSSGAWAVGDYTCPDGYYVKGIHVAGGCSGGICGATPLCAKP